ncbi:MAG: hypothetical protein HY900_36580 [Deltaproteobacteria bacterium]|nr:hypothetical protein [Deltaproteobacteria bacterium]
MKSRSYCQTLRIDVPDLRALKDHREANTFSLLLVALLERGEPMTLAEVARRFNAAGVAPEAAALASLQRCRPARPPVYREGDRYALDPHDDELDLWLFRLGLRPPKVPQMKVVRPEPPPLPGPEVPLTAEELREAWKGLSLFGSWSAQRTAVAVLDAHRRPMRPDDVVAFVKSVTQWAALGAEESHFGRRGSPIRVREDVLWELVPGHEAVSAARRAVRERLTLVRRWETARPDPAVIEANRKAYECRRSAHAAELAALRRVVVYAFPAKMPDAVVLVDVEKREVQTYLSDEFPALRERLASYDIIAAEYVRGLLSKLTFDPCDRRLAELGPPQKTIRLNRRGRTLKITTDLLVQGSRGISHPFGEPAKLERYLREGQTERLRRRLEADAKSLYAFYEYGRLHGSVRLRWGFLDEMIPAPWVHRDESTLFDLLREAETGGETLEVVWGSAPGWADPWARAVTCRVERDADGHTELLIDEAGWAIDDREVQAARRAGK